MKRTFEVSTLSNVLIIREINERGEPQEPFGGGSPSAIGKALAQRLIAARAQEAAAAEAAAPAKDKGRLDLS